MSPSANVPLNLVGVMLGGALGAATRYGTTLALQSSLRGSAFPYATLLVNVVGCFLLAFLTEVGLRGMVSPSLRLALGTGYLGALTTFSTFEVEGHALLAGGRAIAAAVYLGGNLVLGYLAVVLGRALALRMVGAA